LEKPAAEKPQPVPLVAAASAIPAGLNQKARKAYEKKLKQEAAKASAAAAAAQQQQQQAWGSNAVATGPKKSLAEIQAEEGKRQAQKATLHTPAHAQSLAEEHRRQREATATAGGGGGGGGGQQGAA
ncbi:unnamed protein product, partial [Ectocarpus sp. 12 AP-2014]